VTLPAAISPRVRAERRALLLRLFESALRAADPMSVLPPRLPDPPAGRTVVIGAGKAAATMARAVELNWDGPLAGLVVTRHGHGVPCERLEVIEAAHPLPDETSHRAAVRIRELTHGLTEDDLVLCLMSGGGSSLLSLPAPGITLDDKRAVGSALLRSGATIAEINCVRKHLSLVKGGQLAAACLPARVLTFVISDVPGDDPAVIASGPTVADPTTFSDALAVLARHEVDVPPAVLARLKLGAAGGPGAPKETPKPGDGRIDGCEVVMLARSADALRAAAEAAHREGINALVLGDAVQGEARDVARAHAALAIVLARGGAAWELPCVLLSGGETTVTVRGPGRGGRNTEYLLALASALDGEMGVFALAADTDGIDGMEDAAGALVMPDTLARAVAEGLDPASLLAGNDSHSFFERLDDLVVTGPTRTNVNDFRAILVERRPCGVWPPGDAYESTGCAAVSPSPEGVCSGTYDPRDKKALTKEGRGPSRHSLCSQRTDPKEPL
jgi:glycerate 2-kinase